MSWTSTIFFSLHIFVIIVLVIRIIRARKPVGTSLAWIFVIALLPYFGPICYLLFGEVTLGRRVLKRSDKRFKLLLDRLDELSKNNLDTLQRLDPAAKPVANFLINGTNLPLLPGNHLDLISDSLQFFDKLILDIKKSETFCHLLFYIWAPGGRADDLGEALIETARRGVKCRVLLDAVGSRPFLKSRLCKTMREAGVEIVAALDVGPIRMWFKRIDIRNHRKIAVIDNKIAYTGSQNIADPRTFKASSKVGQWVDAAVTVRGPAVDALNLVFLHDWAFETNQSLENVVETKEPHTVQPPAGSVVTHIVPSGPSQPSDVILEILISLVYAANKELIITTPYLVPTDTFTSALTTAALSGTKVTIVVPEKVDSWAVKLASQACYHQLLQAGVHIKSYQGGLLHSKTVTVDDNIALIGSVNMDMRSFYLNYEISVFAYDKEFTNEVKQLQKSYLERSRDLHASEFENLSPLKSFAVDTVRLLGPLL